MLSKRQEGAADANNHRCQGVVPDGDALKEQLANGDHLRFAWAAFKPDTRIFGSWSTAKEYPASAAGIRSHYPSPGR